MDVHALPGAELIMRGLEDLAQDRESVAAALVSIGAPRLRAIGLAPPRVLGNPEHRLYDLLAREDQDTAHGRYNSLIRRLVAFERAAGCVR